LLNIYIITQVGVPLSSGGVIGEMIAPTFLSAFNEIGASLILIALLLVGTTLMFGVSWIAVARVSAVHAYQRLGQMWQTAIEKRQAAQEAKRAKQELIARQPVIANREPKKQQREVKAEAPAKKKKAKKVQQVIREAASQPTEVDISNDKRGDVPSIDLLDTPEKNKKVGYDADELESLSRQVEMRLEEFGIIVKVVTVYPGPVVTRFELELSPGMKVSKITGLAKDLARSLSKPSVRVVEVIPGKAVIGLEIPNEDREIVRLKEILSAPTYTNANSPLSLGLGKDIAGHPVIIDVAKMPHMLVAGTTGAGKSVSINAMILSILLKATPEEVKMIMIDPKMLELSIYEGIPHLLAPVVTNMKEAANSLRWCVSEMDKRYRLMAALSVRNLVGFNEKVKKAAASGNPIKDPFFVSVDDSVEAPNLDVLPKIVVVIDELADMMMVVGKKVEELIARIAQKARAAGIHMILATQRPSVDVITGLIKANVPCRIAFNVSSRIDSRTILDQQGAEQLLGNGDMLYLPPGTSLPVRVHGAYVADDEVLRVVAAWKKRGEPQYLDEVTEGKTSSEPGSSNGDLFDEEEDSEQDALYDTAVAIVIETRRASISSIQRRLKIGYNRAARMMDAMEAAGIVSPMESSGAREVLVPPPQKDS
jgi:S-DNA-T family DNA segregation ATPase FtsK/SpoIIIE